MACVATGISANPKLTSVLEGELVRKLSELHDRDCRSILSL